MNSSKYSQTSLVSSLNRKLQLEKLESRILLAGDTHLINFQLDGVTEPTNYLADTGEVYGARGNGQTYGWSSDHTDVSRDRGANDDQRLDTLIHFHQGQSWEFEVPAGVLLYEVTVAIGDAGHASTHTLNVEGVNLWNAETLSVNEFAVSTVQVVVFDGKLTLDQGAAAEKATRIDYIQIVNLPIGGNMSPADPIITEPATAGQQVYPSDVHLEAVGFSDPEGDLHLSTDWEIWTTGPGAERVWQTLGITGVERLHTHLGDGVFENSHAGRIDLLSEANYEVRVRFRDDVGSVSNYFSRTFQTSPSFSAFPLQVVDVLGSPVPTWVDGSDIDVILPAAAPSQSQLRLESAAGGLLLSVTGSDGITNNLVNPPPLAASHPNVRLVLEAGSDGLNLDETDLEFIDDQGQVRTILLPAVALTAGQRLDLWVASSGATYYGTALQTEPDFSNLARQIDLSIPFAASQPGFEIDVVAGGLQLPVNIAFVPNPGPNPNDPLFYVTELYGTIKVVTNNFTVSDYATDLLNFNPTGNFPGSGEQGLAGIVVDPATGDVIATRVTDSDGSPGGTHHPQVIKFTSLDGGLTAATETVILDMVGESQGQSHQVSTVSIGPDGKLYVHNGDGFDASTAQDLDSFRGKILRMDLDGSAPTDNIFYNAANGIGARDYIYASGLRNPFGGAWRASDNKLYEVENGPSIDRFAQVNQGVDYGWTGSNGDMFVNAIYNWNPSRAPVNVTFAQLETFGGSGFPSSTLDKAYVSESGPTYAEGPQPLGKRIVQFELDAAGNVVGSPTSFVEYVGTGRATVAGLTVGPDGMYFTDLYKDLDAATPIDPGARIYRVRYTAGGDADLNTDGFVDAADFGILANNWGPTDPGPAGGDLNGDTMVDAADVGIMFGQWTGDLGPSELSALVESTPSTTVQDNQVPASSPSFSINYKVIAANPLEAVNIKLTSAAMAMELLSQPATQEKLSSAEDTLQIEDIITDAFDANSLDLLSSLSLSQSLLGETTLAEVNGAENWTEDVVDEVFDDFS